MRYLIILGLMLVLLIPAAFGFNREQQANPPKASEVAKTHNTERFVFPYSASNYDRKHPLVYTYDKPKGVNWILTIQNNMTYALRQDAKTVIKMQEQSPSDKFVEITMFGDASKKLLVAVNTKESGYVRVYQKDTDGWSREQPLIVGHANNQGLTVTNGKRIIIDRLSINGLSLGSIAVYGKDDAQSALNTYAGYLSFDVIFGDPADSPIFYLPLVMLVGTGIIVTGLLLLKKRKISSLEKGQ